MTTDRKQKNGKDANHPPASEVADTEQHFGRPERDVSREFNEALDKAKKSFAALGERLRFGVEAGRHRVEASLIGRERSRMLEKVGERVCFLVSRGETEGLPEDLVNVCLKINNLDQMIEKEKGDARSSWQKMKDKLQNEKKAKD